MDGWEALMAAFGGLLLGLGLGVGSVRRREPHADAEFARRVRDLTQTALPWLRARAELLGAPPEMLEQASSRDPLVATQVLLTTVQRLESETLPYNDTLEMDAAGVTRDAHPKRGLPR
jgi:hypothetical protein